MTPATPPLAALRNQPMAWMTVLLAIMICGVIVALHLEQRRSFYDIVRELDTLRQARIDLSEGFVQFTMAGDPMLPFNREQGYVLIAQALTQIRTHAINLDASGEALAAYEMKEERFYRSLERWNMAEQPSPRETIALLLSFHELELEANGLDEDVRGKFRDFSIRIDQVFTFFLSLAAILLMIFAVVLLRFGHAQAVSEQARCQVERDLALLNSELEQRVAVRTAELERANQAKDMFLANMSHELRTPLNAIMGFTGTLLMKLPGPLTFDQERQLNTIQRSSRHLLSMINDILDMAKIESGRLEIHSESVNCQEVLNEVIEHLRPMAEQKGLELGLIAPQAAQILHTDRRALNQIMLNLVSNAIKFTDHGAVRIELSLPNTNHQVAISVVDTGIGIREADLPLLFVEFGRVNSAEVRQREGTGLGLHLSQRLAEMLGGIIQVQSRYGEGSIFTLYLPG
ncbi:sensor histidine kinase [Candidatus Oscillochloris fontis]|uniref:sensor histidine kinase n=1 Tax=Candidatus Oscillochloris fontis TaxID=2496868 RepID=UPI00101CEED2|nr:ATP-binding protein [Candidatus Oscillochloris fontis]